MRFRTRDYSHVTERDIELDAQEERVAREQELRSDAEREAASYRKPLDSETTVYDLIHGRLLRGRRPPQGDAMTTMAGQWRRLGRASMVFRARFCRSLHLPALVDWLSGRLR